MPGPTRRNAVHGSSSKSAGKPARPIFEGSEDAVAARAWCRDRPQRRDPAGLADDRQRRLSRCELTSDSVIAVGDRLRGVPEFSASLWATYRAPDPLSGIMLSAGTTRVGKRRATLPIPIASRAIRASTCRQTFRRETLAVGTRTGVRWRPSGREAGRQLPRLISIALQSLLIGNRKDASRSAVQ